MKRFLFLLLFLPAIVVAQEEETESFINPIGPEAADWQFRYLIDAPAAGALQKGEYSFEVRIFSRGGVLVGFNVGLFSRFNMGILYGGTNIIGDSKTPEGNDEPGVEIRYRLLEEKMLLPALVLGYTNQGYGRFQENPATGNERYRYKSKGLYAALSKNYNLLGHEFGIHGGVNFNTSETEDDEGLNFYTGLNFALNEELLLIGEYDFGINDNTRDSFGRGDGYLHGAVRWAFSDKLIFQFNFKDILGNRRDSQTVEREIRIVYVQEI